MENPIKSDLLPILYVIKNILQRGNLQNELGVIHKLDNFEERFLFATKQTPIWCNKIKGDKGRNFKSKFDYLITKMLGNFHTTSIQYISKDFLCRQHRNFDY